MRLAIVLFNLGGPDRPASVEPFLFNLFNDPAIIRLPTLLRRPLAKFIARRRAPIAAEIYENLGGGSPLLPNTQAQARALADKLGDLGEVEITIAMRYWHPMTAEAIEQVKRFQPDVIVLTPLYPQFSTTTTASSNKEWIKLAKRAGLNVPTRTLCCYPRDEGFVAGTARNIREAYAAASAKGPTRLLFSAHGLPKRTVAAGDPYQWQVEQSSQAVVHALNISDLDWAVCYQSRVGPLEWIGPATEAEIQRAATDGRNIVLCPIAFVSEHSETLVELDIEYRHLAEEAGVTEYLRVSTVGISDDFIGGLAQNIRKAIACQADRLSNEGGRICPETFSGCPWAVQS